MPRTKRSHIRTYVNKVLAAAKHDISTLQAVWTSRSTVYEMFTDDNGFRNGRQVPRPAADYAENDLKSLSNTLAFLDHLINGLTQVRNEVAAARREVQEETAAADCKAAEGRKP